jgi:prephenate dehydrogenase
MSSIPSSPPIQRVAICGLGLIGGSVLKGLRAAGFGGHVAAFDLDAGALHQAQAQGFLDEACAAPDNFFTDYDVVVLCQPVRALVEFLAQHAEPMSAGRAVVIDVASVKVPVVRALRRGPQPPAANMVPCHPVAGKAKHGFGAAQADLFRGKLCVMTPETHTDARAVAQAQNFWSLLGARTTTMDADRHDQIYAALSHLPQVLSYAYLHSLAMREEAREWLAYRGTGFDSFARLGASDTQLWADIAIQNAAPLVDEIDRLSAALAQMRESIVQGKPEELGAAFAQARRFHAQGGLA